MKKLLYILRVMENAFTKVKNAARYIMKLRKYQERKQEAEDCVQNVKIKVKKNRKLKSKLLIAYAKIYRSCVKMREVYV